MTSRRSRGCRRPSSASTASTPSSAPSPRCSPSRPRRIAARTDELAAGVGPDGATSALWGLPIGVKELFEIAGGQASYGSEVLAGRRAPHDSTVVARLRAAGAVIVGSTRSHEFGWGITTQNPARGSTRNPWDLSRVPGGSSGGSAAAVAAGLVALATGTDTGGSIRIPAAFCGVLGLKTTVGRISRVGMAPLAPSFDTPGFLARSIELLRAALVATAGPDTGDPVTIGRPPVEIAGEDPRTGVDGALRFAVPAALLPAGPDERWRPSLDAVVAGLRAIGGEQVEVEAPDAAGLLDVFAPMQMAEALHVHEDVLGHVPGRRRPLRRRCPQPARAGGHRRRPPLPRGRPCRGRAPDRDAADLRHGAPCS